MCRQISALVLPSTVNSNPSFCKTNLKTGFIFENHIIPLSKHPVHVTPRPCRSSTALTRSKNLSSIRSTDRDRVLFILDNYNPERPLLVVHPRMFSVPETYFMHLSTRFTMIQSTRTLNIKVMKSVFLEVKRIFFTG